MKCRMLSVLLCCLLLTACGQKHQPQQAIDQNKTEETKLPQSQENCIVLSEGDITFHGSTVGDEGAVFVSHDIIYYEDRDSYDSGHAYGEGEAWEKHTASEAAEHRVINITAPGTYTLTGTLPKGQIRVDLGEDAFTDPKAVVNLVLQDADITCTVAPAILFLNVYECDNQWKEKTPAFTVDTAAAGANLILEGESSVNGSHVARIYKDGGEEKKLWKQDAAVYSYMSMNVSGSGALDITADNEGLDTELHLTVNSGKLNIRAGNDGINTNEDGVSVTTINGGEVRILAGLGEEGDGIDSNGWLVINGGTVISGAKPMSDAGLDSDMGSYINGGTVVALGSTMDWAESDSQQVTMNLQFANQQQAGSVITLTDLEGNTVFSFDTAADPVLSSEARTFQGLILSCPALQLEQGYRVQINGADQTYAGTDVQMRPGMGGFGGRGEGFGGGRGPRPDDGQMPDGKENMTPPEGFTPGQMPDGFGNMTPPEGFTPGKMPDGMENMTPPDGFVPGQMPEGIENMTPSEGFIPGQRPDDMEGQPDGQITGGSTLFFMQDKVNNFSGVTNATEQKTTL